MKLIDTHAHLDFPQYEKEIEKIITNAQEAGVSKIITIGCSAVRSQLAVNIAEKYPHVFAAVGVHPSEVNTEYIKDLKIIEQYLSHPKVVAVGECGIDLFKQHNSAYPLQEKAFLAQINLAKKYNKPVIIHFRDAKSKGWKLLSENHDFPFVVHCYSEDLDYAHKIIDLGGLISFTGIVTFPNAQTIQEVARAIPLDKIMLETDAPFLAPQKYRGKRCEPAYINEIAHKIAELKKLPIEEVAKTTTKNAEKFFGI